MPLHGCMNTVLTEDSIDVYTLVRQHSIQTDAINLPATCFVSDIQASKTYPAHLQGSPSCSSRARLPGSMALPHSSARSRAGTSSSVGAAPLPLPLLGPPSSPVSDSIGPSCHADAGSTGMLAPAAVLTCGLLGGC